MAVWYDIAVTQSERVHSIDEWWRGNAGDDVPDRVSFDPVNFKRELPFLLIADLVFPFRIYYRLVGTAIVNVSGMNFTGRYLDELDFTGDREPWVDRYKDAVDRRRPVYGICQIDLLSGDQMSYEYGIWPLTNGGAGIGQFLAIEDYAGRSSRSQPVMIQTLLKKKL